jgi:hypothetical protein
MNVPDTTVIDAHVKALNSLLDEAEAAGISHTRLSIKSIRLMVAITMRFRDLWHLEKAKNEGKVQ